MASVEVSEMKAGHPPAVKAGSKRISRHRQLSLSNGETKTEMTKEEIEEYGTSPPREDKQVWVSGVRMTLEKAFPPAAVKQFHKKPVPILERRPVAPKNHINQPK